MRIENTLSSVLHALRIENTLPTVLHALLIEGKAVFLSEYFALYIL